MRNCKNVFLWAAVAAFLFFAVLYFVPAWGFVYKKTIPSFLLALTAWICVGLDRKSFPALMAFGFAFACFGDLMGDFREFIPQLLCFAVCHLFYIIYFAKESMMGSVAHSEANGKRLVVRYAIVSLLPMAVVLLGLFTIVLKIALPMNIACAFYLIMISTMLYFAILTRQWLFIVGAVCFVVSDYILAYNKFVAPLPYERYLIMVPYYAAILGIFLGVSKR